MTELWWPGGGSVSRGSLAHFDSGIVALAGFYSRDGVKHVIVATEDRALTELWWQAGDASRGSLGTASGPIVALAGYQAGDGTQHVIVALSNGTLREVRRTPGDAEARHDDLGIVPDLQPHNLDARIGPLIDAYVDAGGIQHAIVTTSDGAVHERDGLVEGESVAGDARGKRLYRLTDAGRSALDAWVGEPVPGARLKDEFFVKFVIATSAGLAEMPAWRRPGTAPPPSSCSRARCCT